MFRKRQRRLLRFASYDELRGELGDRGSEVFPFGVWEGACRQLQNQDREIDRLRGEVAGLREQIRLWHIFANGALGRERRAEGEAEQLAEMALEPAIAAWERTE